ncbi:MAG: leucine-rich repeat domain-containing protein [Ruminococcaceae bacterium]|nr:leucine-rich repeat domain-containing protein [Oscillospiraceae bacterium]
MKKILFTIIFIVCALTITSCDTNDASYYLYDVNEDGTLTVMGVSETYSKELSIPKQIDGKTVTAIGDYAFYNNQYIRKITLPDSVLSIGECAFADSRNLSSVKIGKQCLTIGLQAFEGCSALKTIRLSDTLTEIKDLAFHGCTLLESFDPPKTLTKIGIDVFDECEQLIINAKDCPAIEEYAKIHQIPTGFTESDDYLLIKIASLSAAAIASLLLFRYILKKIRKKTD